MKLYQITTKGLKLARSINSPDSDAMRVIYYMDKQGSASAEQIAENSGAQDPSTAIGKLKRGRFLQEV